MARSEVYFDSGAAGGGDGSKATPYNDLNAGIKAHTFDTTNGTRCNLKGTFTLTEKIDTSLDDTVTTPAWAPAWAANLVFEGYTTDAGDGGLAIVDGNATYSCIDKVALNYTQLKGIEFRNSGANAIVRMGTYCSAYKCKFHNNSSSFGLYASSYSQIVYNQIYNCGGTPVSTPLAFTAHNIIDGALGSPQNLISNPGGCWIFYNILKNVSGSSNGIKTRAGAVLYGNTIYSDGGTGTGIINDGSNVQMASIMNNIIEGFSGVGGEGINLGATNGGARHFAGNRFYNNETDIVTFDSEAIWTQQNTILSSSPFTDAANGDFSPLDIEDVKEAALPADFYEA